MDRLASIRRYREQVLNAAALMTAIASARLEPASPLLALASRQDAQLADLLHDFAYRARKLLELAEREGMPIGDLLTRRSIVGSTEVDGQDAEEGQPVDFYSLQFILGRLIHSDVVEIQRSEVQLDGKHADIRHELPWAFLVRSDKDKPSVRHFIFLEFLLEEYLEIDEVLEEQLRLARL